jgi:arylsulfatase A-like enzyme/Flp pilus assembly protein TadD
VKFGSTLTLLALMLGGCSRAKAPLNLVLVSVDTLRADHLSCYGSKAIQTPHFDRIAREGILFENLSTVVPITLPAHASLFTGTTPVHHGVHYNVGFRLRDNVPTLATTLKGAGYRTGGFVGSFVLDRKFGLGQGFDHYSDEMPDTDQVLPERKGEEVLEEALAWIEAGSEGPFFAFLHFYDPHHPYDPPPPFDPGVPDPAARYLGEVAYVDSLLGRLLGFLETRGILDSTVLVVTADHGESLGEHGEEEHGFFVYQSTLHVPLLVRAPMIAPGKRVDSLVRTIDIAPTVLELLGVEAPSSFEGESFITAAGKLQARDVAAYSETYIPRLNYGWSELRSLRRRNWKFVLAPRSELYDVESDPLEERNRIDEERDIAQGLRAGLDELIAGRESVVPERADEKTLTSLRSLGYVSGATAVPADRSFSELPDPKDEIAVYNELLDLMQVAEARPADLERVVSVLEKEPKNARALELYGKFLLDLGRLSDARKAFVRLVEVVPAGVEGHYGLGRALLGLGEIEAARASFERALALDPKNAEAYSRLSALEKSQGNLEAAEKWLRQAIAIEPSRLLYQDLADLLLSSGREAELSRMAGDWKGPGAAAAAAYARGQLLASSGNLEQALTELESAARLAPEDINIEQAVANTLSRLGRFEDAMRRYQSIVRRSPCYLGALTNLGAIYERLGKVDDAIRSYESAIACDPSYALAYRNLGATLARKGDIRRALDVLREARRLLPQDRELQAAIVELEGMLR